MFVSKSGFRTQRGLETVEDLIEQLFWQLPIGHGGIGVRRGKKKYRAW